MLQRRKKDFLQRLIEEFFKKLQQIVNEGQDLNPAERLQITGQCFDFFSTNFQVSRMDETMILVEKIGENELLQQYAQLLMTEYDMLGNKNRSELLKALSIIEYLESTDITYSWERTILREDILNRLDEVV